ncbi:hypothetical protein IG631_06711 [Alternaria alternata]|nr:hypothetical protein IG631_06711 [Alternaria alternata]
MASRPVQRADEIPYARTPKASDSLSLSESDVFVEAGLAVPGALDYQEARSRVIQTCNQTG